MWTDDEAAYYNGVESGSVGELDELEEWLKAKTIGLLALTGNGKQGRQVNISLVKAYILDDLEKFINSRREKIQNGGK